MKKWSIYTARFQEIGRVNKRTIFDKSARYVFESAEAVADCNGSWEITYFPTEEDARKEWKLERENVRAWTEFAGNYYLEFADIAYLACEIWDTDEDGEEYFDQGLYRECAARSLHFDEGEDTEGEAEVFF